MSVLIKGIEMPESCGVCYLARCPLYHKAEDLQKYCIVVRKYPVPMDKRLDDCPLVEVANTSHGLITINSCTLTPAEEET